MKRIRNFTWCLWLIALSLSACAVTDAPEPSPEAWPEGVYRLSTADHFVDYQNPTPIQMPDSALWEITRGGEYVLTGQTQGQICIDAQDEIVYLLLDGASLHSPSGPAIYVKSAAKLVITLKEGTVSALTDSANYRDFADQDACIFSNTDLTINGGGTLEISGYHRSAIRSRDVIKVLNSTLEIKAKRHGLRGTDGVILHQAQVSAQCEGCGIVASKADKPGKGFVAIDGGSVSIIAGETGIRTAENLYMQNAAVHADGILQDIDCSGAQYVQEGCLQ